MKMADRIKIYWLILRVLFSVVMIFSFLNKMQEYLFVSFYYTINCFSIWKLTHFYKICI